MKAPAQAIKDARAGVEVVSRELGQRRGPNADARARLVRQLAGATTDLTTAEIGLGYRGLGTLLVDQPSDTATFTVTIELGNEAMQDEIDIAEALGKIVDQLDRCEPTGLVRDRNGNTVGRYAIGGRL